MAIRRLEVRVIYATSSEASTVDLLVPIGTTVLGAVERASQSLTVHVDVSSCRFAKNFMPMRFSKFFKSFSLILCTTPFILSCVSSKDVIYFNNASEVQPTGLTDDTTIRIQPNDELTIRVSAPEQEAAIPYNLTKSVIGLDGPQAAQAVNVPLESYIVDDNGYIQFPELGKIQVSGYTSIELADLLEEKIRPYLKEPLVTIRILNFQVKLSPKLRW